MAEWKQEVDALDPPPRAAVVEVPLLFESGMEAAFDATIAVVADEDVRAERAGARGHAVGGRAHGPPALAGGKGASEPTSKSATTVVSTS